MTKKQILTTGISMLAVISMITVAPQAMAQDSMSSIINSGDNARVHTTTESVTDINVQNSNRADIQQKVDVQAITGQNTSDGNINLNGGSGSAIHTGNAVSQVGLQVQGNHNMTAVTGSMNQMPGMMNDIVNTGDNTRLNSNASQQTRVQILNKNDARVGQDVNVNAISGRNMAEGNIGSNGSINSGNAGTVVGLQADLNKNETMVGIGGNDSAMSMTSTGGQLDTVNTGDGLHIDTNSSSQTRVMMKSENYLNAMQRISERIVSGGNNSDGNIGGSSQTSGAAGATVGSSVMGNHNTTMFGSMWDLLMGWMI